MFYLRASRNSRLLRSFLILVVCVGVLTLLQVTKARVDGPRLFFGRGFSPLSLGTYPDTTVQLSANTTITPDAEPTATTTSVNVSTSTNFKGKLEGDPTTGKVRVTDAHPAGSYTVTVTAFDGVPSTKTFTLTVTTPATCNPVSFATATNFQVGSNVPSPSPSPPVTPFAVAVGDFNRDGNQDLATANYFSANVSVLLGDGAGSFGAATNFGAGTDPRSIAVGDFNGDGKQDLAVANFNSNNVSILRGDGAGSFSAATNFLAAPNPFSQPFSVAVGDFNGDGKQDLAVTNLDSNLSVLLGDGAAGFGPATPFAVGAAPFSVAVGDFNGDGRQDLATANAGSANVSVMLGKGDGGFDVVVTPLGVGTMPFSVAVGDFNGDGNQDLTTANRDSSDVSVLLGDGAGGFSAATNFLAAPNPFSKPFSVAVGDFNGDGAQDLAVTIVDLSSVSILLGQLGPNAGNFSFDTNSGVGTNPFSVAVGDFNGDGKQDLATANLTSRNVSVLLRECPPTFSISDVTVIEGNNSTVNAVFTASLSSASGQTVTVNYATADGTATAGSDYQSVSSSLTFNPGVTSLNVNVPVIGDTLNEANESFTVNLSGATNAIIAKNQGLGTINNDDPLATLSIDDRSVTEGDIGTVNTVFTVSLSPASGQTVTVNYATADGTATAGNDYLAVNSTTLTFNPGVTSLPISVPVIGDAMNEANETFFVNLSDATNANIADNQGQGTITNDDALPTLSINDHVSVTEGNSGTVNAVFTVTLSPASGQTVTVNYATADGTATAGIDYQAGSSTLIFNPGVTSLPVNVQVTGDTLNEANETFFVNLSGATNATIDRSQGVGTINDDDSLVLNISDVSMAEGNSGTVNVVFTVSLSLASAQTVTVNYATADGTAAAGTDYQAISSTMLTFNPGETSKLVSVVVTGDTLNEANETFSVNLSSATNATIADSEGVGTIVNDDPPGALTISDVSQAEGNTGTTSFKFTVSLSPASGQTVAVTYATENGTATAGDDYQAISSTTFTFSPGEISKLVTVIVSGDTLNEAHETFFVNLTDAQNAMIVDSHGVGTIINDDPNSPGTWTISGKITDAGNNPLPNVAVTLAGPITLMAQSDVKGEYSFSSLKPGEKYVVTVQSALYVFAPSRVEFSNLGMDQTANFIAAPISGAPPLALSDDFTCTNGQNTCAPDPGKWSSGAQSQPVPFDPRVTVVQVGGELVIRPLSPREGGLHYNGIVSASPFDLNNGQVSVEVVQAATEGADTIFATGTDSNNFFRFMVHTEDVSNSLPTVNGDDCKVAPLSGRLSCLLLQAVTAGQLNALNIDYDPVKHRFMRFRYKPPSTLQPRGAIAFEASRDGITYGEPPTFEPLFERQITDKPLEPMRIELSAGTTRPGNSMMSELRAITTDQTDPQPAPARFDDVKVNTLPFSGGNLPTVLAADQVQVIKTWSLSGRSYAYVKLLFPNAGYRVVSWGQPVSSGNDFSADAVVERSTGGAVQAVLTTAHIYDLGPVTAGDYTFTFKNSGVAVKSHGFTVSAPPFPPNPIDDSDQRRFVRQQYLDFLNREPDAPGWDHWTGEITQCTTDPSKRLSGESEAQCIIRKRANTSAAFFLSPEFQNTGYFVLRVYRGSLGRMPYFGGSVPADNTKDEFTRDHAAVSAGIVVNHQLNQAVMYSNKQSFVNQFVTRSDFLSIYGRLDNEHYVDKLFETTNVTPTPTERQALIDGLSSGSETRASVLFKIVDGRIEDGALVFQTRYGKLFYDLQLNPGFVQMEYFGYLKRDPDDAGYAFWLSKLNEFGGDFINAQMVLAFISSPEYRARFGQP
jgi:hypothetical protein